MKQHSKKEESNSTTNISVTSNNNTTSGVSTKRKDKENEMKDEELKKHLNKLETRNFCNDQFFPSLPLLLQVLLI